MRRVIVDQIEALAELNRIVARHGRGLDTVEPTVRRAEATAEVGGRRRAASRCWRTAAARRPEPAPAPRPRADITGTRRRRRPAAPARNRLR